MMWACTWVHDLGAQGNHRNKAWGRVGVGVGEGEAGCQAGCCPRFLDTCVPSLTPASSQLSSHPLQAAPWQGCGTACPARRVRASVRGAEETPKEVPRGQGACIPGKPPPSLGGGCGRGPRDLEADIPQRPRDPNWQGQLQTGAGPALFPRWHPLSIRPCSASAQHCFPSRGSVGSWHCGSPAMSA